MKGHVRDLIVQKADELKEADMISDLEIKEEEGRTNNEFWLKKMTAEVYSDSKELNKDFTLSNLSDNMFESRVVNFIRGRIFLVKLLEHIFKFANKSVEVDPKSKEKIVIPEKVLERVKWETYEYIKTRNLILTEVYTILNMSKARGGLILKAFLEGGMEREEAEMIAGAGMPAMGEEPKRSMTDRILGRKKLPKRVNKQGREFI